MNPGETIKKRPETLAKVITWETVEGPAMEDEIASFLMT
jgi:hypothetical protein